MKSIASKNRFYFAIEAIVLVAVNLLVWTGVRSGQLPPVDNVPLWAAFVVLNVVSLLWAVRLLDAQPLVVALSYVGGGFLAYQGVRGMPGISVAEVTTAGTAYGAIGALAIGNATTKVRLAFLRKKQVPFVFIVLALLVLDGVLNSRIAGAGWSQVLNALIFPFVFSGIVVALVWMVVSRFDVARKIESKKAASEGGEPPVEHAGGAAEPSQLVIQVPEVDVQEDDEPEPVAVAQEIPEPEPVLASEDTENSPEGRQMDEIAPEPSEENHFFPLEIDKDEGFLPPSEDQSASMDTSPLMAEEPVDSAVWDETEELGETMPASDPVIEEVQELEEEEMIEIIPISEQEDSVVDGNLGSQAEPEPKVSPEEGAVADGESDDWLSNHLDLLSKITEDN